MKNKKFPITLMIIIMCLAGISRVKEQSDHRAKKTSFLYKVEGKYLECVFDEELYDIMFDKEPYKYRISYEADYYLPNIYGEQDLIYIESFVYTRKI